MATFPKCTICGLGITGDVVKMKFELPKLGIGVPSEICEDCLQEVNIAIRKIRERRRLKHRGIH